MPGEFIDTNILVYAYDNTAGVKHQSARKLMEKLWVSGAGIVSTQVLQEFHVTVTRRLPQPITARQARGIISDLSTWTVAAIDVAAILRASEIAERYITSFWDGLIIAAAENEDASVIWSEDLNHGKITAA